MPTLYNDLPYPAGTDTPYVHLDIKNLADAVDEALTIVAAAAPPHRAGRLWYDTNAQQLKVSDGTAWRARTMAAVTGPASQVDYTTLATVVSTPAIAVKQGRKYRVTVSVEAQQKTAVGLAQVRSRVSLNGGGATFLGPGGLAVYGTAGVDEVVFGTAVKTYEPGADGTAVFQAVAASNAGALRISANYVELTVEDIGV